MESIYRFGFLKQAANWRSISTWRKSDEEWSLDVYDPCLLSATQFKLANPSTKIYGLSVILKNGCNGRNYFRTHDAN